MLKILIPDNISGSELFRVIQKEFQLSSIEIVRRKYFNESKGAFEVEKKGTPSSLSNIQLGSALYLALAAANCVLQFFEFSQGINFAPKSLNVVSFSFKLLS